MQAANIHPQETNYRRHFDNWNTAHEWPDQVMSAHDRIAN
jgi:hypothetical protein